ncbi:hypothetical protein BC938DRAFT_481101, partial [Jimgerdemannia flammicorona]
MSTATETQDHHSKVVAAPNLDSLEDLGSHETVIHHPEQAEGVQSPITRIVFIAVDQSFHSGFAFDWAINNLLRPENDLVILANVRGVASVPGPYAYIRNMANPSLRHFHPYLSHHSSASCCCVSCLYPHALKPPSSPKPSPNPSRTTTETIIPINKPTPLPRTPTPPPIPPSPHPTLIRTSHQAPPTWTSLTSLQISKN